MARIKASEQVQIAADPLEILRRCGGYYDCPKDSVTYKRLGPLVGYAGKYDGVHQWVGDVYFNFAKAEEYPQVINRFANLLVNALLDSGLNDCDVVMGMPMGGIAIAQELARLLDCRFVYAEKKVTALATPNRREQSELVLNRHEIRPGDWVIGVEDVFNNFSTTGQTKTLVESHGGTLLGLAGLLNRSTGAETVWEEIPIASMLTIPTQQYQQDDPYVAKDVATGNVVWKPKNEWPRLAQAAEAHK